MPSLTFKEITEYSQYPTNIFIETGTFMGETTNNVKHHFERVISIELSDKYASMAIEKFKNDTNVSIIKGDSSEELYNICKQLDKPAFFWLDGHWSNGDTAKGTKDCPLLEELQQIVKNCAPKCIVAIDDVRLFTTTAWEDWSSISKEAVLEIVKPRLESYKYYPSSLHPEDRLVLILNSV